MRRLISCGALVPGCAFIAHGTDGAQVVRQLTQHMSMIHGLEPLSRNLQTKVHSCIEHDAREAYAAHYVGL